MEGTTIPEEPLRERIPGYLAVFAMGVGAGVVIGVIVWLATAVGLAESVGYTFLGLGTLLLLTGGARGGGYSNLGIGAVEAVFGGRNRSQDDYVSDEELRRGEVMKKRDPMARLRRGLRPQANPTAFWQVIAGFLYIGIGVAAMFLGSGPAS